MKKAESVTNVKNKKTEEKVKAPRKKKIEVDTNLKVSVKEKKSRKVATKNAINSMKKIAEKQSGQKKLRIYKEPNKSETETTVNVLYWEGILSIYTNKVDLQKQLIKILGTPTKEDFRGRSTVGTRWDIPLTEKNKLSQMILKANLFEL